MKKVICLIAVALMIASVALAAKNVKMTAKDLAGLKGTWEGIIGFGTMEGGGTSPATLEILNDTVPVKAKLTIRSVPQQIASPVGLQVGQNVAENDKGAITTQGTLAFQGEAGVFEVSLTSDKNKISVWYMYKVMKGEGDFKKKK